MKVKVIVAGDIQKFQDEINEFIKDKDIIDILYSPSLWHPTYNNGVPTQTDCMFNALIMYREVEVKKEEKKEEPSEDIKYTSWVFFDDRTFLTQMIKCTNCGHTLDFIDLGRILPAACPCCHRINK